MYNILIGISVASKKTTMISLSIIYRHKGIILLTAFPTLYIPLLLLFSHFATPWTAAVQVSLSFTISWSLLKPHVHWVNDAIQPCHPLSPLLLLPSIFPSIRVFSSESAVHIRWPKYWSFSLRIGPSNEYSGLISFSIYWFDLLAIQGTLKSLLQHHSSKHQFFGTQPSLWSNSYIHTWLLEKS